MKEIVKLKIFVKNKLSIIKNIIYRKKYTLKQEALFMESLKEINIPAKNIFIDHPNGYCFNQGRRYNIIYPLRYFKTVKSLDKSKIYHYNFIGLLTEDRNWVKNFESTSSIIKFTDYGRKINKAHLDIEFYTLLSQSKFTLCPKGDFNWSYRFFEAILCKSIPIIDEGHIADSMKGFIFFYRNDISTHIYDEDICKFNYMLLLKNHSMIGEYLEI